MNKENIKTLAFVDASNLFYGGEKSLGWKVDYCKLLGYLQSKYLVETAFYFGGVELHGFKYDYLNEESVSILNLESYLIKMMQEKEENLSEGEIILINRHLKRVKFYKKLEEFGYKMCLKPVKRYEQDDGNIFRKANCDVDMTLYMIKEINNYNRAVILTGDGDFFPVLKYLKKNGKDVIVISRSSRTAKEIRQFCAGNFKDFTRLQTKIEFIEKKREGHTKYPSQV